MSIPWHHFFLSLSRSETEWPQKRVPTPRPTGEVLCFCLDPPSSPSRLSRFYQPPLLLSPGLPAGSATLLRRVTAGLALGPTSVPSPSRPRISAFPDLKHVQQPTGSAKQAVSRQSGSVLCPTAVLAQIRLADDLPVDIICFQAVGVCLSTHSASRIGVGYNSQVRRSTVGSRGKANRHGYCQRCFH